LVAVGAVDADEAVAAELAEVAGDFVLGLAVGAADEALGVGAVGDAIAVLMAEEGGRFDWWLGDEAFGVGGW